MSEECIHGFTDGLCATCNPKPASESVAATSARPIRSRTTTVPRKTVRSLRAASRVPLGSTPTDAVFEQRVYHLTHIRNLPGILNDRAIIGGAPAVLDLLSAGVRAERQGSSIVRGEELSLADFVPFFLSPESKLWLNMRSGRADSRTSADARQADIADFVFLVSSVRHVVESGHQFVVIPGGPQASPILVSETRDVAERILYRLRMGSDADALLEAELLVADRLPLESITVIGVAHDRVRAAVRELLAGSDFMPKVSVYPPWFVSTT